MHELFQRTGTDFQDLNRLILPILVKQLAVGLASVVLEASWQALWDSIDHAGGRCRHFPWKEDPLAGHHHR